MQFLLKSYLHYLTNRLHISALSVTLVTTQYHWCWSRWPVWRWVVTRCKHHSLQSSNIYITVILRPQLQCDKSSHAKHENNYTKFTESSVTMPQYRDY